MAHHVEEWQVFVKASDGKSNLHSQTLQQAHKQLQHQEAIGSGEVAGSVSDSEPVNLSATQVGQSAGGEDVACSGSTSHGIQVQRSVRLRVHELFLAFIPYGAGLEEVTKLFQNKTPGHHRNGRI